MIANGIMGNRLIAHAILRAVEDELQGNSALSGGVGAVSGELASKVIINTLYSGKDVSELTEDVNNPSDQAARQKALEAIERIESAIKGHGI